MSDLAFEKQVIEDLASLKRDMHSLVGNGQPGRIKEIELKLEEHTALINRGKGAKWVIGIIGGVLALAGKEIIAAVLK